MGTIIKRNTDPERAQSRRTQVLDAAAICFARSGFHGASMAEISKQAGMSAGHIYNYFDNKDAIIMAFVAIRVDEVTHKIANVSQQDDPLAFMVGQLDEIVDEHLDSAYWGLSLEIFAEAARNPVIAAALQAADADARVKLHGLLARGRAQRGLASDDATIAARTEAIITMFNGLPLRGLHHPALDRAGMVAALGVAMKALLMS